jgi:hypothetical protein
MRGGTAIWKYGHSVPPFYALGRYFEGVSSPCTAPAVDDLVIRSIETSEYQ